MPLSITDL